MNRRRLLTLLGLAPIAAVTHAAAAPAPISAALADAVLTAISDVQADGMVGLRPTLFVHIHADLCTPSAEAVLNQRLAEQAAFRSACLEVGLP